MKQHGTDSSSPPVADPGFPIGGVDPLGGGVDPQRGHFLVKMKELGPMGGGMHLACSPLDPPMATLCVLHLMIIEHNSNNRIV